MKRWYQSKTVWFNVASALVAASTELGPLADMLPETAGGYAQTGLLIANIVGNLILRTVTTQSIR